MSSKSSESSEQCSERTARGEDISPEHPSSAYPRPRFRRKDWSCLDGNWDFAFDRDATWRLPAQVCWQTQIRVPFAPETQASGIGESGFFHACWYRREFGAPPMGPGERLLLHFGAVDHAAIVWVNGRFATRHEGGYTPFQADITDLLEEFGSQVVVVRAEDDPHDLDKPRGKQDWQRVPHSIWYPRTTGIWQTVWMERVPPTWIRILRLPPGHENWQLPLEVVLDGERRDDLWLEVKLCFGNRTLAHDRYAVIAGEVHRRIALSDPGIEDFRNELLWSPESPNLIEAEITLQDRRGVALDEVSSYTALRSLAVQGDQFVLNGRPYPLRMVLDQGYWPGSGMTAPDDQAMRRDVELARAMGFNGVRKHQKIESPRYLYWADRLGLLIWEEMPSAYRYTRQSIHRMLRGWTEAIERDSGHPCIVAWVPLNESWGVPDLPDSPAQRHYVQALYHLTRTLDPTRPVVGNDGWESVATDIIGIHDYDVDADRILVRYGSRERASTLLRRERPGGRQLILDGPGYNDQPIVLTEFGGIAFSSDPDGTWGYSRASTESEFALLYTVLLQAVRTSPLLAGFCYTQFADTYQESNGLLYADRTPKIPIEQIAEATVGSEEAPQPPDEQRWRGRLMEIQRAQYQIPPENYRTTEDRR
ncbi:MAG: glycoside hydrolase family 2 TIM barrel-domain containing protein [Isosphaeraceae bacterium]